MNTQKKFFTKPQVDRLGTVGEMTLTNGRANFVDVPYGTQANGSILGS